MRFNTVGRTSSSSSDSRSGDSSSSGDDEKGTSDEGRERLVATIKKLQDKVKVKEAALKDGGATQEESDGHSCIGRNEQEAEERT